MSGYEQGMEPTASRRTDPPRPRPAAQVSARSLRPGRSAESRRTAAIALASNVTIAVVKVATGAISGSAAMLAEAAHSLADTATRASC